MKLHDLYFINGVFYQERGWLTLGFDDRAEIGVFVKSGICQFIYGGLLERDPHSCMGTYCGHMRDDFGTALLEKVIISADSLTFTKKYVGGRPHDVEILYEFRPEGQQSQDVWVGNFNIPAFSLQGPTRCILTPLSPEFFQFKTKELKKARFPRAG